MNKSYSDIDRDLSARSTAELLHLMNAKSIKVGDTAADLIARRGVYDDLIHATLNGHFVTKLGKIRAINVLSSTGRKHRKALDVYLAMLQDENEDVVDTALLPLVLWGESRIASAIRQRMETATQSRMKEDLARASQALATGDVRVYSPHFEDPAEIWGKSVSTKVR